MFRPDSPADPAGPAGFCFADVFVIFSGWVFTEGVFKGGPETNPLAILSRSRYNYKYKEKAVICRAFLRAESREQAKEDMDHETETVDYADSSGVAGSALVRDRSGGQQRHLRGESDLDADFLHRQAGHFRLRGNDGLFQR